MCRLSGLHGNHRGYDSRVGTRWNPNAQLGEPRLRKYGAQKLIGPQGECQGSSRNYIPMVFIVIRRTGKCAGGQAAAGDKYGGDEVRRGGTFGYHLWPRTSTRLKPRSITSVCLLEITYEGLSTKVSHGHVHNDLLSKFTSAVNSSPAALSPRPLPTSKSNQNG